MIENTSTKILYSADGTNKVFDIPFDFINNEDVVLSVKLPTDADFTKITENYLVNKAMATITYPVSGNALVADSSVLIERNTPVTQLESSAELHFTSSDVERGLDKITMIAQEIKNSTDGYANDIKTLRKDNDDLGGQVHNIEAKIPQAASDSNQLVDKASMTSAIAAVSADLAGKQDKGDYATEQQLTAGLQTKQDAFTVGDGLKMEDNVLSATGSGGGAGGGAVNSVNGKTGDVVLSASDVGAATTQYVDSAVAGAAGGSPITGLVVSSAYGVQRGGVNKTFRTNIGTRTYKFITLELCNANQTTWTTPLHSCAGYGNRSGNFANIYVCISAKEFEDNLILDGDTFGYKVTLWY